MPDGSRITVEPLLDADTGLYARLSYTDAAAAAKQLGIARGRLPTMAEVYAAWDVGHRLQPVTLVHTAADNARMRSLGMAEEHDRRVREQIAKIPGAGKDGRPIANIGKDKIDGATPGYSRNGGWVLGPGRAIQPGGKQTRKPDGTVQLNSEHHEAAYTDYSELTRIVVPAA